MDVMVHLITPFDSTNIYIFFHMWRVTIIPLIIAMANFFYFCISFKLNIF